MMKISSIIFIGLIAAASISCDKKEEEPEVTINDFVGSWEATNSVFTNKSNSSETIDIITIGGDLSFTMLKDGGVRTWITLDSFSDEWDSQAVLTNNNTLTLTPVEMERGVNTFEFILENNSLTLTNHNDNFDFSLSEAAEVPASSVSVFVRK